MHRQFRDKLETCYYMGCNRFKIPDILKQSEVSDVPAGWVTIPFLTLANESLDFLDIL